MNVSTMSISFWVVEQSTGKRTTLCHYSDKVTDSTRNYYEPYHLADVSRWFINEDMEIQIDNGKFRKCRRHNARRSHAVVDEVDEMNQIFQRYCHYMSANSPFGAN